MDSGFGGGSCFNHPAQLNYVLSPWVHSRLSYTLSPAYGMDTIRLGNKRCRRQRTCQKSKSVTDWNSHLLRSSRNQLCSGLTMEDEMDSLFQGMVLFTPSQLPSVHPPSPERPAPQDRHQLEDLPLHSASSEPLDENLFSDLTIVDCGSADQIPQEDGGDQSSSPASVQANLSHSVDSRGNEVASLGRQVSRKKKRAAGLRIGYGRESTVSSGTSAERSSKASPSDRVDTETRNLRTARSGGIDVPVAETSSKEEEGISKVSTSGIQSDNNDLEASRELGNAQKSGDSTTSSELPVKNEEISVEDESGDRKEPEDVVESDYSVEEKFEKLKGQISSRLDNSRTQAASLSASKKECVRKRRKVAERLSLASLKYKELEKQLEEACEAEDFEVAEKVSQMLGAADSERQELVDTIRDVEAECDAIDVRMDEVLHGRIVAEEECIALMEDFSADATASSELIVSMAELQYSERMDHWFSSMEALEGKKIGLDIESFVINEAYQVLNGSIDHSIEDDQRQKEMLLKKRDVLHCQLEELLSLVQKKEQEIAENDANIKLVEQRIDNVVSGFRDSLLDVEEAKGILKSNLSKVDAEGEELVRQKKDIDDFLSKEEEKGCKIRELAKVAIDEAKAYRETFALRKELMQSMLNFREIKLGLGKSEEMLSVEVQTLQSQASSARASLQELSSTKSSLQQDVASFEQRIIFVDKRLPELESEKKVAASARNFKEAARIAAVAKLLGTEKESLQNQLEKATSELGRIDEKIRGTIDSLQEAENQIFSKEREVALAQFQRLLVTASAAKAERTAALELGDEEEANILFVEMEAAELEAGKLRNSYNFKDEDLGNLPKGYVPIELVSNLNPKQLADLAASADLPAASQC